jgi:hypothetical protein
VPAGKGEEEVCMVLKRTLAVILLLVAFTLPGEAAKRSVHLFGETFVFNFTPDFAFTRRINKDDGRRQTVTFTRGNLSIVVSGSRYDPENTEPLITRDFYLAKAAAEGGTDIIYLNEETDGGRAGSHMIGSCKDGSCIYRMARATGRHWLSVLVICETCTPTQADESRNLADTLYRQLKSF